MGKTRTPILILLLDGVPDYWYDYFSDNGHEVETGEPTYPLHMYDMILGPNCRTYLPAFESDYGRDLLDQIIKLKQKEKKDASEKAT